MVVASYVGAGVVGAQVPSRDLTSYVLLGLDKIQMKEFSFTNVGNIGVNAAGGTMATKVTLDRNVQTVLSLLNLPSRADLNRLLTKLEVIQGNLTNLSLKVDRLEAARKPAAAPPRKPARKTRKSKSS